MTRTMLDPFLDTLQDALHDDLDGRLQISIYVDGERDLTAPVSGEKLTFHGVPFSVGRVNPEPHIKDLTPGQTSHVFVCGPPGLAATADLVSLQHGVSFHKEVFAF
mmetsp:Transcript_33043/g.95665  ORF Transcript_33043/g.95665 Transcript_33043/m.95665 type:complete len:106 (+) Transcript_33043:1098-1415(+)